MSDNFYANCGTLFGRKFGDKSREFKHKAMGQFKAFVDANGGPNSFSSAESAVRNFFSTFQKGKNHGR